VFGPGLHVNRRDEVGPRLGPEITADFPEVLAALVNLAGG